MLDIRIKTIPHAAQRYDTLGDYWEHRGRLQFAVSEELGDDYAFLVTIHELIESYLTKKRGISWERIDDFDKRYEQARVNGLEWTSDSRGRITKDSEPGDDKGAPYYKEHQFASCIERLLANEMGIDWHQYEADCVNMLDLVDHKDRRTT